MKPVGATYGKSVPHQALAVIISQDIGLYDFVMAGDILCQVKDITITSNISMADAKKIASGKTKKPLMADTLVALDLIGRYCDGVLTSNTAPIKPGTILKKAGIEAIKNYLRINDGNILIGTLVRRKEIDVKMTSSIYDNHVAIVGMTGQGKSNTGKVMLEEITKMNRRVIIIDPHGEYAGDKFKFHTTNNLDEETIKSAISERIKDCPNRKLLMEAIGMSEYPDIVPGKTFKQRIVNCCNDEYIPGSSALKGFILGIISSLEVAKSVECKVKKMKPGETLTIDLSHTDAETSEGIVEIVARKVLEYGKAGKGYTVFIDEAHRFVPQKGTPLCKIPIRNLIQEGRKFGCGVILLSQRPANIEKDALSQCNTKIVMKITNDNDIRQVRQSTEYATLQMFREVQKLRRGEALISSSELERPIFVKVRRVTQ